MKTAGEVLGDHGPVGEGKAALSVEERAIELFYEHKAAMPHTRHWHGVGPAVRNYWRALSRLSQPTKEGEGK